MIENLQDFTAGLPALVQWLGIVLAGAIPFVESYLGSVIGIAAGLPFVVAVAAAVMGNVLTMVLFVSLTHRVRSRVVGEPKEMSPRRRRLRAAFDKYGVAGVSLLGQTILPSQITSAALVSFGAPKAAVIRWQVVSIILWGLLFGGLTLWGIDLLADG
ncbi:hypothetical protein [Cellulomonas bogoriensis]|uniref:Membrane protein n=1 Tax=Cellulomonas bogoriensis 69B4 = DSM 16987 TaxID=1386082 RepID=A0A0A0BR39_9CELL|nr:hypothetical protein [Cellulomonas bogoriensis]KGM10092.1 membrane protein [Cellulomonas bogoriensis 69B4 = DSM 16987]